MKFIFGLIAVVIGFSMVWKTQAWFSFFGRIAWAEKYLGTEGGSRLFYKLLGIVVIVFGLMAITGLYDNFMGGLTGKLVR